MNSSDIQDSSFTNLQVDSFRSENSCQPQHQSLQKNTLDNFFWQPSLLGKRLSSSPSENIQEKFDQQIYGAAGKYKAKFKEQTLSNKIRDNMSNNPDNKSNDYQRSEFQLQS